LRASQSIERSMRCVWSAQPKRVGGWACSLRIFDGWFSLRGAPPWELKKKSNKRHSTILYGGRARNKARVPVVETVHRCSNCCGFRFRACSRQPQRRRARGTARLRRRVAQRSAICPLTTSGCHIEAAARAVGQAQRRASPYAYANRHGPARVWLTR
jgi:hypothetical protein